MSREELELGLPEIGNKLFVEKDGLDYDYASINRTKGLNNHHSEFLIIEGYRESTKELLTNLLNDKDIDWLKIDSKIYPILFLFRHYLEAILKSTIRNYNILNNNSYSDEVGYVSTHSLLNLWNELKPFLEKNIEYYEGNIRQEYLNTNKAVESIITEIENLDKNSFGFRYPFVGAKKINDPVKYSTPSFTIDLSNLKEVIIKMTNYFEGVHDEAIRLLDEKQSNDYYNDL
jgi:hypothetical protein